MSGIPKDAIVVPQMCEQHQAALVAKLRFTPTDPWQMAIMVAQIMLFQNASNKEWVWQRCSLLPDGKRDGKDLSLVLAEIGCLACLDTDAFRRLSNIMLKRGVRYAAQLSRGEIEDAYWGLNLARANAKEGGE